MDTNGLDAGVAGIMFLFPIVFFLVFELFAVIFVSKALLYVKAGRPAWLSLIPLYNFIELFDIAGVSVWWALPLPLVAAAVSTLFFFTSTQAGVFIFSLLNFFETLGIVGLMLYLYFHLAKRFGQSGWYTLGYLFLPFIFFPMLGFGKAKFKGVKKKKKDLVLQRHKLIVTGILTGSMAILTVSTFWFFVKPILVIIQAQSDASPPSKNCYDIAPSSVNFVSKDNPLNTDPSSFTSFTPLRNSESGNCYGKDANTVFFEDAAILGADAATFHTLDQNAFYAADAKHVYRGAAVIENATTTSFTDLGHGYAKGKHTVFYFSTGLGNDGSDNGDLITIFGADVKTFKTVEGMDTFDAQDKNHMYQFGAVVATSTLP